MNAAYTLVLSLFLLFNGGHGAFKKSTLHNIPFIAVAQQGEHLHKHASVRTSNSDLRSAAHDIVFIDDSNDNPDSSLFGALDFILLSTFCIFFALRFGSRQRSLPLCLSPNYAGTCKYLKYRSIRI